MNKKKKIIISTFIVILILCVGGLVWLNTNKNEEDNKDKDVLLNGESCGEYCYSYKSDMNPDKKYKIEYNDGIDIDITFNTDYTPEENSLKIYSNGGEVYGSDDITNEVKIFKFKDIYVISYGLLQSQCGNTKDLLFDSDGNFLNVVSEWEEDKINDTIPSLMKTEYDSENSLIISYKEQCMMCYSSEDKIGYKYTYKLEKNDLILQEKEDITCNSDNK